MSERKLGWCEWAMIGIVLLLLGVFLLCGGGCQWSAYNSVTVDPNDGVTQRVGIGTIEFFVIDAKKGLSVETWEGTKVRLNDTRTDPDDAAMRVVIDAAIATVQAINGLPPVLAPSYGDGEPETEQ